MLHKLFCIFLLLGILNSTLSYSQDKGQARIDSLIQVINNHKTTDTTRTLLLSKLADYFLKPNPDTALLLIKESKKISDELHFIRGQIEYYVHIGSSRAKSITTNDKFNADSIALTLVNQSKYFNYLPTIYNNLGNYFGVLDKHDSAIKYLLLAINSENPANEKKLVSMFINLSREYLVIKDFNKALNYGERAIATCKKYELNGKIVTALGNTANVYLQMGQYDKAATLYKEEILIADTNKDPYSQIASRSNYSILLSRQHNYVAMLTIMQEAHQLAKEFKNPEAYSHALIGMADALFYNKKYQEAKSFANEAIVFSKENSTPQNLADLYKTLSNISFAEGQFNDGIDFSQKADSLQNETTNNTVISFTKELETKYETEKKETQLKLQQSTIKQKNTLNILFGSIAAAILGLSLFGFKNYKHKQTLQQQKISELETQQKLTATEAVLKGEEQERTRLAKDLHDGLGGMLSGIKYSFNTMKGNMIMTPDNAQAFERSMDMLDSSIKEMRRVAHNMMPEALVKFGLDTALKDFCNEIQQSGALQISYQSIGLENTVIDQTVGITIYRIVQELINNTMKHAVAKNAIVQVTKTDGQLSVTVEDDGKGFDTAIINKPSGMGWSNIANRVEFLKGKLDVNSQSGKGTSVLIEINI
jgi:two-component system, NarL family, sensor kinase